MFNCFKKNQQYFSFDSKLFLLKVVEAGCQMLKSGTCSQEGLLTIHQTELQICVFYFFKGVIICVVLQSFAVFKL